MSIKSDMQFNLNMLKQQVDRIAEDQMCLQPSGLVNHPAWNIGHLAVSADGLSKMLGGQGVCPADWDALFYYGTKPTADASAYPDKATLLTTLEKASVNALEVLEKTDVSVLEAPPENEQLREMFATMGDFAGMLFTSHMGMHVGEVSAWSRVMGFDPLF